MMNRPEVTEGSRHSATSRHPHARFAPNADLVYETPRRVYWELTRACGLACKHCRAEAQRSALPDELSCEDGFATLEALAASDPSPIVILTGGDPLERPDFWRILAHARELGLHVDVAPSATPLLTRQAIARLKEQGVGAMSLSLDAPTALLHDGIRGIPGCFDRTLQAANDMRAVGMSFQVNTLVTAETRPYLSAVADRIAEMGARRWSLFFLVQTGRGKGLAQILPEHSEEVLTWAYELNQTVDFVVATTEAPHYRRIVAEQRGLGPTGGVRVAGAGMRDGNGIMFIAYNGDVAPSGFLPIVVGNVRDTDPVKLYRQHPIFKSLRDPDGFGGKCGTCSYRRLCGGSRGRAFATIGDPLAEDPLCVFDGTVSP